MEKLLTLLKEKKRIILVSNQQIKNYIMENLSGLNNITYKQPSEVIDDFCGYYDAEALYKIRELNDCSYQYAQKIFDSLRYQNTDINKKLGDYYHYSPLNIYEGKEIIMVGNMPLKVIKLLDKFHPFIYQPLMQYTPTVYEFETIIEEVEALANQIARLIDQNKKRIAVFYANKEYPTIIKEVFPFYHLNFNLDDSNSLFDYPDIIAFFNDLKKEDINNRIEKMPNNRFKKKLIDVINSLNDYTVLDLKYAVKKTKISPERHDNAIDIWQIDKLTTIYDYTFIIGVNQNIIPHVRNDIGYLDDEKLANLGEETSTEANVREKKYFLNTIKAIKYAIISYPLIGLNCPYEKSRVLDEFKVLKPIEDYTYSLSRANLALSKKFDQYVKYQRKEALLEALLASFPNYKYHAYKNNQDAILDQYIPKDIYLSYSKVDTFYQCPYRFFLEYILRVETPDNESSIVGTTLHRILERYTLGDDIKTAFDEEFANLNLKDVYLKKQYQGIMEVKKMLDLQRKVSDFVVKDVEKKYCQKIKDNLFLNGKIDKVLTYGDYAIVVDYKAKNKVKVNLDNLDLGMEMQLLVYFILLKDYQFAGCYLAPIYQKSLLKRGEQFSYKLVGYSNKDVIAHIDRNYAFDSFISSMSLNKNGEFNHHAKMLNEEEYNNALEIVRQKICEAGAQIEKGNFPIKPIKERNYDGCMYCPFGDLCFYHKKGVEE